MFLPRRLPTPLARHLLALVAAFAQLVAATGAPLPARAAARIAHSAPAPVAPAETAGPCGKSPCCCTSNGFACCCAPKPATPAKAFVWVGGTFQQKCNDLPMAAGLLKFEFLAPDCGAVPLPAPARAFAPPVSHSPLRTSAEPPVPPPKLPVM